LSEYDRLQNLKYDWKISLRALSGRVSLSGELQYNRASFGHSNLPNAISKTEEVVLVAIAEYDSIESRGALQIST
jgi:hypothetical protein